MGVYNTDLTDAELRASAVPVSAASLPLPTGAATAALQTQPGVDIGDVTINNAAGASAVNIQDGGNSITVDGTITANAGTNLNTSALALDVTLAKLTIAQGAALGANTQSLMGGSVTTSAPTYTTGQISPLSLLTTGALRSDNSSWLGSIAPTVGLKVAASSIPVIPSADITYACVVSPTLAANPTDVFTIYGSATKTIRIRAVTVGGTNTGNTNAIVRLVKRSAVNTGGTSAAGTNVPMDSTSAAATATTLSYTANPTTGATVGVIRQRFIFLPLLASSNVGQDQKFTFSDLATEALILRGTSEGLAVNFNGIALGGTTVVSVTIEWTES